MRAMRASGLPTALDPVQVAKNVQRAQKERATKMAEVEAEMAKVAARMQQKKMKTFEEMAKEEATASRAAAEAADSLAASDYAAVKRATQKDSLPNRHDIERQDAERKGALAKRKEAERKARTHKVEAPAPTHEEKEKTRADALAQMDAANEAFSRWQAKDHAPAEQLAEKLVHDVEARATGSAENGAANMIGGLFSKLLGGEGGEGSESSEGGGGGDAGDAGKIAPPAPTPAQQQSKREEDLAAMQLQYKTAERKVRALRATGGLPLSQATEEMRELKPRLKVLEAACARAKKRAEQSTANAAAPSDRKAGASKPLSGLELAMGAGTAAGAGAPTKVTSLASLHSARRLERQRARMESRGAAAIHTPHPTMT